MSSALAIAGVTAVLRHILETGLVEHDVAGLLGNGVTVTVAAPTAAGGPRDGARVDLALYSVDPNASHRNATLPSRDPSGLRSSDPPLALDLHYLLSIHARDELHAEVLLGYAMLLLRERSVLTRETIRAALVPSPDVAGTLPPVLRALGAAGLEDRIERVVITPRALVTDAVAMRRAEQTYIPPSVAYTASVVLIEAVRGGSTAPPVRSRDPSR